jgi:hypothetical protein
MLRPLLAIGVHTSDFCAEGKMKKVILMLAAAAAFVGCSNDHDNTIHAGEHTMNDPSGAYNQSTNAPGSTNFGTDRAHSYESSSTPEKKSH